MPDVIVIGGGLSGLAAAWELERQAVPYTLIEVKGRLGGSIISERRDEFVMDGGPFVMAQSGEWAWLDDLGLSDALYKLGQLPNQHPIVAFKDGTQTLVDALARQLITGRIMPRMSVSTLGEVDGQFAVCLENGMVIQAAALIVAAPARYAERMFYTFQPKISEYLLDFHYDPITHVSLGYPAEAFPLPFEAPPDAAFAFGHWTESEYRVPPGHVLLQVGVRFPLSRTTPEGVIGALLHAMNWPAEPVISRVDYWPESHCLNPHHPEHVETMQAISEHLPPGVALIGSDYRGWRVEDRVEQGLTAAREIATWLRR
jgi:protoporphyrinogen oxidase